MAKSLIGIDINSMEASMVTSGKVYFETLPENVFDVNGIVAPESELLPNSLMKMKKNGKIKGSDCAVVIPHNCSFFKTVSSPVLSHDQIKLNLPYEYRNFVGGEPQKYYYDYFVDSVVNNDAGEATSLNLVTAAALKQTTEDFAECLRRAGFNLKLALPREVCLINLMKKTAQSDKEYCLVGCGYEQTSIYLFNGDKLEATKFVDLGARDIDKVIAETYSCDERLASNYRVLNHDNCLNNPALTDIYDRIALEVMKTINFYRYEHNDSNIDTVYFFDLCADDDALNIDICNHIGFVKGDISELLPAEYKNVENAARELYAIGLTL